MAWTQTDIDNLDAAYKGGAEEVTSSDGKKVRFRSLDEYMRLRAAMLTEVLGPSRKPSSFSVARIGR